MGLDARQETDSIRTFKGAVAIVTGGASGIGLSMAQEMARQGAEVVLADRQGEVAAELAEEIRAAGGAAQAWELDVREFEEVRRLVAQTVERTGRLDYMFNNAGIAVGGPALEHGIDDWAYSIDVNLRGVVNGVQAAFPIMAKAGFGHIVNTSSMAGLVAGGGMLGYTMTKHAVVGLSLGLRIEAAASGVRVSVLCPGVVRTAILDGGKHGRMLSEVSEEEREKAWKKTSPMEPDLFARKTLKQVARNKAVIVVPAWWKIFWWLYRFSPGLTQILGRGAYKDFLETLEASKKGGQGEE